MFGAIAGGIASALAGGAMSKLFGGGQKAASGGIQGDVLATDNNTVGMGDAGIKSAIQGSNVPNPDEAVPRSEERFSRNAETDLVCRLLLEKKKLHDGVHAARPHRRVAVAVLAVGHHRVDHEHDIGA